MRLSLDWAPFLAVVMFLTAGALEIINKDTPELICSQGLTNCNVSTDVQFCEKLHDPYGSVFIAQVQLTASLVVSDIADVYEPCLQIHITLQRSGPEGSGDDEEEEEALVKVGLSFPSSIEVCRAVTFNLRYSGLNQESTHKDSPTNKLLYAKEIPEYKKRVQCYYKQIQEMAPLSEQEMNAHLAEESRKYRNEFNTNLALTEIYKYAKRYRNQVVNALEANPTARRTQLHYKFDQVVALMEDNIYECCSEA